MKQIYLLNTTTSFVETKIEELQPYLNKKNEKTICYSKENGIFIEEKGNIYYIEASFNDTYQNIQYLTHDMVVQTSSANKILMLSQLPIDCILHKHTYFEYRFHPKAMITLIVIGIKINNDKYKILDFYFECPDDVFNMDNLFFKEEINRFLSILN